MEPSVLFLVDQKSPRLRYILDVIGQSFWQQEVDWTDQVSDFSQHRGPSIAYTQKPISATNQLWIPAGSFLHEKGIRPFIPAARVQNNSWQLFPVDAPQAALSFDIFSAIFYLISRYEEYLPFASDQHHRFPASESILRKAGRLQEPVVDEWLAQLSQIIHKKFPSWPLPATRYSYLPSYDIDLAWAFKHRPWYRQISSALKNSLRGDWFLEKLRWQTIYQGSDDPFFTFPKMQRIHGKHERAILFFLVGRYGPYDKNIDPGVPALKRLIQSLDKHFEVGLHPSYRSNEELEQLEREVKTLSKILGRPVEQSRQHYLKLRFPQTYRGLIDQGIKVDYSLGYADDIGFRAGIARPFHWYDLEQEIITPLKLVPFMAMDVTLLQLGDPESLRKPIFSMIQRTRAVGGQFCTLWHNNTLSDLPPFAPNWSAFYQEVLSEARRSS